MKVDISSLYEYEQKYDVKISISYVEIEGAFLTMSMGNHHTICRITDDMFHPYLPIEDTLDPLRNRLYFYILTSEKKEDTNERYER